MANDNHAHYGRIGLAVVAGVIAILASMIYIAGMDNKDELFYAESYFDCDVSGVSCGSAVCLRGVKVGEVKSIGFLTGTYTTRDPKDAQSIRIVYALNKSAFHNSTGAPAEQVLNYLISQGLHATVMASGITGLATIGLQIPNQTIPARTLVWKAEYPLIPPAPSVLDALSDGIQKVMAKMDQMDFQSAWSNISSVAANAASLTGNMNALVESQAAGISQIVKNVEDVSENVNRMTERVRDDPSLLVRPSDPNRLPETVR